MRLFLIIYFTSISLYIARGSKTLNNQINKSKTEFFRTYKEINRTSTSYIYGSDGNKIITVNFDKYNNLLSKTSYNKLKEKRSFIYSDDCEKKDCYQFIH